MRLSGRAVVVAILVAVGDFQSAHSQPLLSSYAIDLDERFTLVHSSRDAFRVLDGVHEVLMIDPVWDGLQLDAYCKLPTALFVRAHLVPKRGQVAEDIGSFFIIDATGTKSPATCTVPLSYGEFQNKLLSMSIPSEDVVWTIPADPNPGTKILMRMVFTGMFLVAISGFVLPIPFGLILAHYILLKKRLHRITVHTEGAPV